MKEQLIKIAEALEETGLEWSCAFHADLEVDELIYPISIERKGSTLELTTPLPVWIEENELDKWRDRVNEANAAIDAGAFAITSANHRVYYRVYSLYTREDEIKDAETIRQLLECCKRALAKAAPLTRPRRRSRTGGFFSKVSDMMFRAMERTGILEIDDPDDDFDYSSILDPDTTEEPDTAEEPDTPDPHAEGSEETEPAPAQPEPEKPASSGDAAE